MSSFRLLSVLVVLALVAVNAQAANRTFNFVNQCPYPVWFGIIAGATGSCSSGCPTGSSCNPQNNICYWNTPNPGNNNFRLEANGGRNSVAFPILNNPGDVAFSGAIAGRTECQGPAPCTLGNCVQKGTNWGGPCTVGVGFGQPSTQAEFTLSKTGTDFYDVEIINGISMPITMTPNAPANQPINPYWCGAAGAKSPSPTLGGCSWNFNPPTNEFVYVRQGGARCNSDNDCKGQRCGLAVDFPARPNGQQLTCGQQLGYWSANQICGMQPNYQGSLNCNQGLSGALAGLTNQALYFCAGGPIDTCYKNGANANSCCGCANWNELGLDVPPAPMTESCKAKNPQWTNNILPHLAWMKKGCPTSYTYPYDDHSSTFVCSKSTNGQNLVSYTITYC